LAVFFLLQYPPIAATGDQNPGEEHAHEHLQRDKTVRLQLRISEAKRDEKKSTYYKSIARQQKLKPNRYPQRYPLFIDKRDY